MLDKRFTEISKRLSHLQTAIESVKNELAFKRDTIRYMLHRRGYTVLRENSRENCILPIKTIKNGEDRFYESLKRYSFRIFLRDVIRLKKFTLKDVSRYSSEGTVRGYLKFLEDMKLIKKNDLKYSLTPSNVYSFGDTLEWLIAQIYKREFYSEISWGVKIKDTKTGGDFDVLSSVEGYLVYTEVKSSPPKHIETEEIGAFLNRILDIKPDLSIFLEDTELRMKDKIVPMFEEELKKRFGKNSKIKRVVNEIFSINDRIFIINSKPDLISNITVCIKTLLKSSGIAV